jgi:hypothetical protein
MWVYFQNQIARLTLLARVRALRLLAESELIDLNKVLSVQISTPPSLTAQFPFSHDGFCSSGDSSECAIQEASENIVSEMGACDEVTAAQNPEAREGDARERATTGACQESAQPYYDTDDARCTRIVVG